MKSLGDMELCGFPAPRRRIVRFRLRPAASNRQAAGLPPAHVVERRFHRERFVVNEEELFVGRGGRAGVVRKDPQTPPHGKVFGLQRFARNRLKDPVFLIRARHADVKPSDGVPREVANEAVTEVFVLARRAAVARHCHPARVDDHLPLFLLMPDHGRQDRSRDAVERADAEVRHEEVEHRRSVFP